MSDNKTPKLEGPKLGLGMEAVVWGPNLLLLIALVLVFLIGGAPDKVEPLVATDKKTAALIRDLERKLARQPADGATAIALARLYQKAGELPFSYEALRSAEREGRSDPGFRMKLGMAYIELGKNGDGRRVLRRTQQQCDLKRGKGFACPPGLRARLSIFVQVADLMVERNVNARTQPAAVASVFETVLKKVRIPPGLGKKKTASQPTQGPKPNP